MIRLRCSFAPQVAACSASAVRPALNIVSPSGEPARLGNGLHDGESQYVLRGIHADPVELAQKHRCDADELGYLLWAGRTAWDEISPFFNEVHCEEEFTWVDEDAGIVLAGHPDVFSVNGSHLVLADWKSGFLWSDCESQLRAYAWLLCQQFGTETVTAFHVNIRRGERERFEWNYDELAAWWAKMAGRIVNGRERYSPGYEACRYCPRFSECPAGKDFARAEIAIIAEHDIDSPTVTEADFVIDNYQRAKFVAKICEAVIEDARLIAVAQGSLVASDGRELVIERQKREKIDAGRAWPELLKSIGEVQIIDACTLGKTKAMDAVRATAPRGKKKEAVEEVMGRLREAGAVSETFIEKLELRKAPKMIEQTV